MKIGSRWCPAELNPYDIMRRENEGTHANYSCASESLLKSFFTDSLRAHPPGGGIIDLSCDFFRLGKVMDWVIPQRDANRRGSTDIDMSLIAGVQNLCPEVAADSSLLDYRCAVFEPFISTKPATFVFHNLLRGLVIENKSRPLKMGDGLDLCHAVVASTDASFAALDGSWKRRIENLPRPKGLAHIYYGPELDKLVTDLESAVGATTVSLPWDE